MANANGTAYAEQRYRPWGEKRWGSTAALPTTYRYTGQRQESGLGGADGLYYYGARFYDAALGRFISADTVVPGVGEGGNPNAIGYLGVSTYSPLTVDNHEGQFLEQLNLENRTRLQDPDFRLPPVPIDTIAFDRYAYSLNNPLRYTDPTGHIPGIVAFLLSPPVLGIAIAFVLGYGIYVAAGGPEVVGTALAQAGEAVANGINLAFHRGDWIPDTLLPQYRGRFKDAAEIYKKAYPGLPKGFQLPKELARKLADLLNEGKSVEDAVDEMPELDDYSNNDD